MATAKQKKEYLSVKIGEYKVKVKGVEHTKSPSTGDFI
jgi:hypothetical protein